MLLLGASRRPFVHLGVGASLEPSLHWPMRASELVPPALFPCEGAWKSADSVPAILHSLLMRNSACRGFPILRLASNAE